MFIEPVVAFAGGVLALLSPCSALLLPAFFAYAFASPGRLVARTAIFYLGLLTLFVPLGLGLGALSSLFLERRAEVTLIAGLLLMGIGAYQLAVGGFELPGARGLQGRIGGESAAATYALGLVYGIGGFCSGPILGGVLTLAASSGGAVAGALLLAVFAAGMALPLLVLALLWGRISPARLGWLRGGELRIGPFVRHSSTVASSLIFIGLGTTFIVFQGSNALSGVYATLGAAELSAALESGVRRSLIDAPSLSLLAVLAVFMLLLLVGLWLGRRSTRRA